MEENQKNFGLLLVDDEPAIVSMLKRTFVDDPYKLYTAANGQKALQVLTIKPVDAAIVDLRMPVMGGLELVERIREKYPQIALVILTAHGGIKEAVKAIQLGAADFLEKPFSPDGIRARIRQIYKIWELQKENQWLRSRIQFRFGFDELVGNSTPMLQLKRLITQVGPGSASILIQGETGTGKELVARAVHAHSDRAQAPFVPVDCGAISESVMESELFGHTKGAFTGAHGSSAGLIRTASGGTLFLDEIGELSLSSQVKLLRTIQEQEVRPVGSSRTEKVDVRVVAATNRNLQHEIEQGNFRQDLYYRLNVVSLTVPPLRNRPDDIALLSRYFLQRFSTGNRTVTGTSEEALTCLESYQWPGNVRELENVIRRSVALGTSDLIQCEDLPESIVPSNGLTLKANSTPHVGDTYKDYEIAAIRNAMHKCDGNRRAAAKMLEIGEATLYRKIKKYQI